jgi:hypothetical protein
LVLSKIDRFLHFADERGEFSMRSRIAKNLEWLFAPRTPAGWVHGSSPKRKMVDAFNKVIETDGNVIPNDRIIYDPKKGTWRGFDDGQDCWARYLCGGRAITRRSIADVRPASSSAAGCTIA